MAKGWNRGKQRTQSRCKEEYPFKFQFVIANWIGHHGCKSWLRFKRYFRVSFSAPALHVLDFDVSLDISWVMSLSLSLSLSGQINAPQILMVHHLVWKMRVKISLKRTSPWGGPYCTRVFGLSLMVLQFLDKLVFCLDNSCICSLLRFDVFWTIWLDSTVLMRILSNSATLDAQLNLRWCVLHLLHPWHRSALHSLASFDFISLAILDSSSQ